MVIVSTPQFVLLWSQAHILAYNWNPGIMMSLWCKVCCYSHLCIKRRLCILTVYLSLIVPVGISCFYGWESPQDCMFENHSEVLSLTYTVSVRDPGLTSSYTLNSAWGSHPWSSNARTHVVVVAYLILRLCFLSSLQKDVLSEWILEILTILLKCSSS